MTPEELPVKEVGMVGGVIGGLALLWRAWRGVKASLREDGASEKTAATYKEIIAQLEAQVTRLETRLAMAEKRAGDLEERIAVVSQRATDAINDKYTAEFQLRRVEGERNALRAEREDVREKRPVAGDMP